MEQVTIPLPAMYGDHHVVEVRRILLEMPGVEDVNASSSFHMVEASFDPTKVSGDELKAKLEQAGYLAELAAPAETGQPAYGREESSYFRHTAAYAQTGSTVGFAQTVANTGRPLWPCPGMGPIRGMDKEN